ncbi:hypothetical protein [Calothrix sp. PCC 7507]|uniref:hypothetical protein n=1 Tax=Calothrix sp. PCC 7507 TaxID=99598 RepID=UPI0002F34DF1|nr:hypothetical protein [Calothrix sp. PCC 7507]
MFTPVPDTSTDLATALLIHYSFDLSGYTASELIKRWQAHYPDDWLHIAVIEALYQGRYKAVSVQQLLTFWQRRGQPTYHFNMEFERMICSNFPESLTSFSAPVLSPVKKNSSFEKTNSQLVTANSSSAERKTTSLQLVSGEEKKISDEEAQSITSSTASVLTSDATPQEESSLQPNSNPSGIRSLASQLSTIPNKLSKLLPPATHQRRIGQFTPEKSDRSDLFTSKLKAISGEQVSI